MRNDFNFEKTIERYMQSIVKLIQQRILYHTRLNELEKAKNPKLLSSFQIFVSEFSSHCNAQNRIISNFMQTIIDWKDDIIEENNNEGKRRYRLNENNRELKKYKESNNYKNDEKENKKEKKNNNEMNNIKEII